MNEAPAAIDWVSPIVIVAAALILGALVYFFNKRRNTAALGGAVDLDRRDLEAKRDALVVQLRDVSLAPDERARLEFETANVLRKLDAQPKHSGLSTQDSGLKTSAMDPTVKGFIWGSTSTAALALLGFLVYQQASPRKQGDEITGSTMAQQQPAQGAQQQAPAQTDPQVLQLEAAVRSQPDNLALRNQLAEAYLQRENLMGVFEQSQAVLAKSPDDSRALTFQGLVRMAMGKSDEAVQMLQHATRSDPKNLDGWVALAWIYAQTNRMPEAEKAISTAAREVPKEQARLATVLQQMKQQLAQADAQTAQAGGLPEGHPAVGDTPAPAAPSGPSVRVTLDLDASAKQRSGIVFVIARNAGGGPPVAVKRIVAGTFPIDVELTSADSMMGQPLPASFRLEARLDADGDPMTRPPTDPSGAQDGVVPGAVVRLALK
jgi:cytochrome c-type biogenesis protein CcmH/NrfG